MAPRKLNCLTGVLLLGLLSCNRSTHEFQPLTRNGGQQISALAPYPPGRWRLVPATQLDNVVIWFSHIVIRHRESTRSPAFDTTGWKGQEQGSQRTREEALRLAVTVREKALAAPASFAELAKRYSDDRVTGDRGGSLGGFTASQLRPWGALLDALATMRPGDISRVVETRAGFHILQRRPASELQNLAAQRIVIGHEDAPFLEFVSRGPVKHQTRREALALAQQVAEEARRQPDAFGALVNRYSEHRDADQAGDLGLWTTHEPTWFPVERELLSEVKVGAIVGPVDTRFGWTILRRTPSTERERFVVAAIKLEFFPSEPAEHELSRDSVGKRAQEIARELMVHPERFADFQREHHSERVEQWTRGRVPFGLTETISSLQVGQISAEGVVSDRNFWIMKRLDPGSAPARPEVQFELPSPDRPDVAYFVKFGTPRYLHDIMAGIKAESVMPTISSPGSKEIERVQDGFVEAIQAPLAPDERLAKYEHMLAELRRVLNPADFEKYMMILRAQFEQKILASR